MALAALFYRESNFRLIGETMSVEFCSHDGCTEFAEGGAFCAKPFFIRDGTAQEYPTKSAAGRDPAEWPEDMRVQEFPR